MLCELCLKIRPPHIVKSEEGSIQRHCCIYRHHISFSALIKSANRGCELCTLFCPFVQQAIQEDEAQYPSSGTVLEDPFSNSHSSTRLRHRLNDAYTYVEHDYYYTREYNPDHYYPDKHPNIFPSEEVYMEITAEEDLARNAASPHPERNETLQWLQLLSNSKSNLEQLWITTWREPQTQKMEEAEVRIADTVLTISAGSIREKDETISYCLDGYRLPNKTSLIMKAPALWTTQLRVLFYWGNDIISYYSEPRFEFSLKDDDSYSIDNSIIARNVASSPQSKSCFDLIRHWMSLCNSTGHPACDEHAKALSGHYPRRLVQVSCKDNAGVARIREFPPDYKPMDFQYHNEDRYLILSHCWGPNTKNITKLTKHNFKKMGDQFNVSELPKNFQDAIIVTRELKIPYLWIDSLCIIQDSVEDWAKESTKMAEYYGQAAMTISALCSSAAQEGFLHPRTKSSVSIPIPTDTGTVYLRPLLENVVGITTKSDNSTANFRPWTVNPPLDARGWTLQERLFSTRMLHFTPQQAIFECKSRFYSEDGQYTFIETSAAQPFFDSQDLLPSLPITSAISTESDSDRPLDKFILNWYNLVSLYTARSLTFGSDKLPAVSSAAQLVARATEATYLAGHWHIPAEPSRLIQSLLWTSERPGGFTERLDNGVPSWSWASVYGSTKFNHMDSMEVRERHDELGEPGLKIDETLVLVDSWTMLRTVDPWGGVKGGCLALCGWIREYWGEEERYNYRNRVKQTLYRLRKNKKEDMENEISNDILKDSNKRINQGPTEKKADLEHDHGYVKFHFQPYGELDIYSNTQGYNWSNPMHIALYVASSPDSDRTTGVHKQHFLILRLAGFLETEFTQQDDIELEVTTPLIATYERVGWGFSDNDSEPLPITKEAGWIRKSIGLI